MLARELDIDCDPLLAAEKAAGLVGVSLLHSGAQAYGLGRFSVLAATPEKSFSFRRGVGVVEDAAGARQVPGSLFDALAREVESFAGAASGGLPFYGGAIGYFSYEAGRQLERVSERPRTGEGYDARFRFYTGGIVFDHQESKVYATSCRESFDTGMQRLIETVSGDVSAPANSFRLEGELSSNFSRKEYLDAVSLVRELIRDGEVYQVNLSQRFSGKCSGSSWDLFRRLARESPAPYAAYLDFGDEQVVSSSPERLLYLSDGRATTRPIKGTRPAGGSVEESLRYEAELAESEKDRSELLMIVDLERNDLGRVCRPGSVRVESLFSLERYATVIHQTADVSGELESGIGALDCVKAMFPGGSITGAPKIRSMQVIDSLERGERGVYTGSIGYMDCSGRSDFNIAIRTIRIADGTLSFQVGGGIVWDSDPESEYEETLLKAKAMMRAIGGGSDV